MRKLATAITVCIVIMLVVNQVAFAGSTLDYGQLAGTPVNDTVTYVTYLTKTGGDEILTEDGYNAGSGIDQGYQSGYWWLAAVNFDTENHGDEVRILFTGIAEQSGKAGNLTFIFNWGRDHQNPQGLIMRDGYCMCNIMEDGPPNLSPTFCCCSTGYVRETFQRKINRRVGVELINSLKMGGDDCLFKIIIHKS